MTVARLGSEMTSMEYTNWIAHFRILGMLQDNDPSPSSQQPKVVDIADARQHAAAQRNFFKGLKR